MFRVDLRILFALLVGGRGLPVVGRLGLLGWCREAVEYGEESQTQYYGFHSGLCTIVKQDWWGLTGFPYHRPAPVQHWAEVKPATSVGGANENRGLTRQTSQKG
jgi:hypothetical protein